MCTSMGLFIHLSSLRPLHHKRPSKLIWYKYNVCQTIQSVLWWNNCPIKWITLHLGSGSWQIPGGTFKNRKKTQTLKWLRTVLHFTISSSSSSFFLKNFSLRNLLSSICLLWHHQLDGHEFEQSPGVGDGQGSLAYSSPWGRKESDTTEPLNWTEHMQMLSEEIREKRDHV